MDIHTRIHGAAEWQSVLATMPAQMRAGMQQAMLRAVLYVQSRVPAYPRPPAGSRYRRTLTLGRSLTGLSGAAPGALGRVEALGTDIVGYVGTSIVYAPYVIDAERQAWMHRGRWYTLQGVVQRAQGGAAKILSEALRTIIRR